ncbi:MAG: hypothetical protein NC201_04545 [Prevotella sp.]|nr:hypothetical protein [Bacteroides sp.]MCM1366498.1 hypothetical protein [Prevotella sp.]MCM1436837.1 hypothetical protein [Prevotella sp.]
MKGKLIISISFLSAVFLFAACKGRTMENMEPNGDTVEVNVTEVNDTVITPSGTTAPVEIPTADTISDTLVENQ